MLFGLCALTIVGYLACTVIFYLTLVRTRSPNVHLDWVRRLLWLTAFVHIGDIVARSVVARVCPVLSAAFALSLAALAVTIGFLIWAGRGRMLTLGVIVAPISLGMFIASQVLLSRSATSDMPGWLLAMHVLANLAAVASLVLAAAASIAYLLQSSRLKSKRPASAQAAFPGLTTLESLIQRILVFSLAPMTLGIISGAVFAERLSHGGMETMRIGLAYASWLVLATLVVAQRMTGWKGRRAAWGAIMAATIAVGVVVMYALTTGAQS